MKGLTSGVYLDLVEIRVNCEQSKPPPPTQSPPAEEISLTQSSRRCCFFLADSLLYLVRPANGGVCHSKDPATGKTRMSCYYRTLKDDGTMEIRPEASQ